MSARYREGSAAQRVWLRSRIDRPSAGKLEHFGIRLAALGARRRDPDLARDGLLAFAIADLTDNDIRDFLIGFTLLVHCAGLAGADVPAMLREIAEMSGPAMRTLYREWADRHPDVARIGSMGWRQVETDAGLDFSHGKQPLLLGVIV